MRTCTIGTSMLGKRVMGNSPKLTKPSAMSTINRTRAGTGWWIDQAETFQCIACALLACLVRDRTHEITIAQERAGASHDQIAFAEAGAYLDHAAGFHPVVTDQLRQRPLRSKQHRRERKRETLAGGGFD
jgi:hypothetical protein